MKKDNSYKIALKILKEIDSLKSSEIKKIINDKYVGGFLAKTVNKILKQTSDYPRKITKRSFLSGNNRQIYMSLLNSKIKGRI